MWRSYDKQPNIAHMKTISKSHENKDNDYERDKKRQPNKRQYVVCIATNRYNEHLSNKPTITSMRDIQV